MNTGSLITILILLLSIVSTVLDKRKKAGDRMKEPREVSFDVKEEPASEPASGPASEPAPAARVRQTHPQSVKEPAVAVGAEVPDREDEEPEVDVTARNMIIFDAINNPKYKN